MCVCTHSLTHAKLVVLHPVLHAYTHGDPLEAEAVPMGTGSGVDGVCEGSLGLAWKRENRKSIPNGPGT